MNRSCFDQKETETQSAEKLSEVLTGRDVDTHNILTAETLVYNWKSVDIAYAHANIGTFLKEPQIWANLCPLISPSSFSDHSIRHSESKIPCYAVWEEEISRLKVTYMFLIIKEYFDPNQ